MRLLLLMIMACLRGPATPGPTTTTTGVDTAAFDTALDTAIVTPSGLTIELGYSGPSYGYEVCQAAWLTTLWISVDDGNTVDQWEIPCESVIELELDLAGPVSVQVAGQQTVPPNETNPYQISDWADVTLTRGLTERLPMVLNCHENGVDDGCGGA